MQARIKPVLNFRMYICVCVSVSACVLARARARVCMCVARACVFACACVCMCVCHLKPWTVDKSRDQYDINNNFFPSSSFSFATKVHNFIISNENSS
jgi:hypothetical protein